MRPSITRQPDYSDLDLNFFAHPTTRDVQLVTGDNAIKRSIRNLVFTRFFERPFRTDIGSDVLNQLFENITPFTEIFVQNAIGDVITKFEPRVSISEIKVTADPDSNGLNVKIEYIILNRNAPGSVSLFLERIR